MANLRKKDLSDLTDWNIKELRKLKISLKNRLESYSSPGKPKELKESSPLFGKGPEECNQLLSQILKAEKSLK